MSADGVFFYTHLKLIVGADIRFTAKLSLEYVALSEVRVRCRSKVVRVEKLTAGLFGVAARMESHELWFEAKEYLPQIQPGMADRHVRSLNLSRTLRLSFRNRLERLKDLWCSLTMCCHSCFPV
jgi:hypothetical protein